MNWTYALNFLSETAYLLIVFSIFLAFAIFKGRQAIINIMVGLYLALLITLELPGYDIIFGRFETSQSLAAARLAFFVFISIFTTALCYRIMPEEFREKRFESFWKKLFLAIGATILIMIFSFHVLPVTEFMTSSTPIQSLFGPDIYFFWWLIVPMVILYIV